MEYPINRFAMEVKRQMDVLERHLADHEYLAGADYTIADMATWPWYGALASGLLYDSAEFLQVQTYENLNRWAKQIAARPAVQRGAIVNRPWGDKTALERHSAADIDAVLDAE